MFWGHEGRYFTPVSELVRCGWYRPASVVWYASANGVTQWIWDRVPEPIKHTGFWHTGVCGPGAPLTTDSEHPDRVSDTGVLEAAGRVCFLVLVGDRFSWQETRLRSLQSAASDPPLPGTGQSAASSAPLVDTPKTSQDASQTLRNAPTTHPWHPKLAFRGLAAEALASYN